MSQDASKNSDSKPVVTIFEQYGSGADPIGRAVAEAIGYPYHKQRFSSEDLEGGAAAEAEDLESRAVLAEVFSTMGGAYGGFDGRDVVATQSEKRDLVSSNNDSVREHAEGGGVIVGRNATVILANRPNTVHVLLTGDVKDRVKREALRAKISPEQAERRQRREEQVRTDMSKILYGWDPMDPSRYDLVINTSRIKEASVVSAIVNAVRATSAE